MNTAETGKIVGNRNSHIYHVPGQAGYRMNSANAIYFNSEAEAQAAGYRKAKDNDEKELVSLTAGILLTISAFSCSDIQNIALS